jgi:hypothetical protein
LGDYKSRDPELVEMAAATKMWPTPTMKLKHLKRLHEQRLLSKQRLSGWEAAGEHRVLVLRSGQIV